MMYRLGFKVRAGMVDGDVRLIVRFERSEGSRDEKETTGASHA